MTVRLVWFGTRELVARLAAATVAAPSALGVGLYLEALEIIARAVPITPILTGALRGSAYVDQPRVSGSGVEVTLGFGGSAAPYAIFVHERLDLRHAPPTQAKFLEQPVLERAAGLAERLGLRLRLQGFA